MMRNTLLLITLSLIACSPAEQSQLRTGDAESMIRGASQAFSDAYVRGDTAAIRELYTTNAVLLPPGREIRGRDDIVRYFAPRPNRTNVSHAMVSSELSISGDRAVDIGTWSNTWRIDGAEEQSASDRYLVVWRREPDGQWRIAYDMWHRQ